MLRGEVFSLLFVVFSGVDVLYKGDWVWGGEIFVRGLVLVLFIVMVIKGE